MVAIFTLLWHFSPVPRPDEDAVEAFEGDRLGGAVEAVLFNSFTGRESYLAVSTCASPNLLGRSLPAWVLLQDVCRSLLHSVID